MRICVRVSIVLVMTLPFLYGTESPGQCVGLSNPILESGPVPTKSTPEPAIPVDASAIPTAQGAVSADADFAGAARMYLRGIPAGWRDVAAQVKAGKIKTDKQLWDALTASRRKANNGLSRRLAQRWAAVFSGDGSIVDPGEITRALIDAAVAAEAGLK